MTLIIIQGLSFKVACMVDIKLFFYRLILLLLLLLFDNTN